LLRKEPILVQALEDYVTIEHADLDKEIEQYQKKFRSGQQGGMQYQAHHSS
jgi:hypothetical protein